MSTQSQERWRLIESVFAAVLSEAPSSRDAAVRAACGDDVALRDEVMALLAAHDRTGKMDRLAADVAPLAASLRATPLEGRVIGRYRLADKVGGGGMGVVYHARDEQLGRTVALKFLQAHLVSDKIAAERFRQEARTVAALEHPNICSIFEIGETDDGLLYLAMPYYEGETVQERVARGPLSIEQAVGITLQVLRGLAKAHARGIIHRDIKPSNVLITADELVKLLDFGVAKLADVTLTGTLAGPIGTVAYMSPEQALGAPLDARSDLWSVGVMLYEMLTAQRPYVSGVAAAMTGDLRQPLPLTLRELRAEVSPALDAIVAKALARRADQRYQSAADFEHALQALGIATISGDVVSDRHRAPSSFIGARWTRVAIGAAVLVSLAGIWITMRRPVSPAPTVAAVGALPSLVVLPLVDRSEKRDQQYFADGLTEEIISTLARVDGLKVASSTSSFAYRTRTEDIRTLGAKLGVTHVVEGSLQRVGDQLRVTAHLISVSDGLQLWTQPFERTAGDAFALQQDIAAAVARALQVKLVVGSTDSSSVRPDAAAYELYLKGRYAWATRTESSMRVALRFFEQAAQKDSLYAPALVGAADANAVLGFYDYLAPADAFPKAEAAARRAIALDPTLAAPHATLGYAALYYHWDLAGGENAFKRAIQLNDDYATGHQWYGNLLTAAGRFPMAVQEMQRAQQVDPLSLIAKAAEAWVHHFAGENALALQRLRSVFATNPDFAVALTWGGDALAEMDSLPQAIAMHRRLLALSDSSALNIATLARTLAVAGQQPEARRLLDVLLSRNAAGKYVPSYDVAKVYAALGQNSDAFTWLEKARVQRSHSMVFLKVDPALRALRRDNRFPALVAQVLPE